ncbi:hypothetical protein F5Y13DRAFT_206859 [Hypoxylon sp. FL1857]|nr:hypothetical protein F5Y13DRAFT_206859 [Hypoxylon sp. FL1857]
MCLFLYPAPTNKKSKKKQTTAKTGSRGDIPEPPFGIADEALKYGISTTEGAAMPYPYVFGAEQRFEEYEPGYITRAQWASHAETLKGTLGAAKENGNKIDGLKGFVSSGMTEARDAIKNTQGAIKGTHLAINDTYMAVDDVCNTLKTTYETIKRNHSEYANKQDGCAAEITKVRMLLEEEAKKRDELLQKQQNMQDAWNYYQLIRQAEQDAEPKSSRSSTRSHSSSRSSSSSNDNKGSKPRRQQAPGRNRYTNSPEGNHEDRHHFYPYHADPWSGWYHHYAPHYAPSPGWDEFYDGNIDDDIRQRRPQPPPPPRRPENAARGARRPRHYQGWM